MFSHAAFRHLTQRAFREPGNHRLFGALFLHTEWLGNYAESRDFYTALLDRHPYCGYAWYNLGWVLSRFDEIEQALEAFEFAYLAQPSLKEAYDAYAAWALVQGQPRRAWLCYEEMGRHLEPNGEDLCRLAMSQRLCGALREAKKTCRLALQLEPDHSEACYQLAACFAQEQAYAEAVRWLRQALRTQATHAYAHRLLADIYNQLRQFTLAHRHARLALECEPDFAAAWMCLLKSLFFQQRYDEAVQAVEEALEYIEDPELLYCASACCFLAGRRVHAFGWLERATEKAPHRVALLFEWAPELRGDEDVQRATRF